jgi:peptidoglycan L-alanyl-D-glutamate endopeptidase CwlK
MSLDETIRAVQTKLGVTVDGNPGPQTWLAIYRQLVGDLLKPSAVEGATADPRSEQNIATLLPEVRPLARALIESAAAVGICIKVISGTRTYDEQNALYEQGRTKAGRVVTNARGGYSNHNFGIAFDIGVFDGGRYIDESPAYKVVGALGIKLGLEWGGNWKSIQDEPHFQLRPDWAREMSERDMLAELRRRKLEGTPLFSA